MSRGSWPAAVEKQGCGASGQLPRARSVLAVCAHPDDESFALGAILAQLADEGAHVSLLCLTQGEASSLGPGERLGELRSRELCGAAAELGVGRVELTSYPDGALDSVPLEELAAAVSSLIEQERPELLLAFDEGGVTGHRDHHRATEAALATASHAELPVLAWALPEEVAEALNQEFGTSFTGRAASQLDLVIVVDRTRQLRAVRRHASQSAGNPVLWRRLELQGDREALRWLHLPRRGHRLASVATRGLGANPPRPAT